jgi:hypothetical protein
MSRELFSSSMHVSNSFPPCFKRINFLFQIFPSLFLKLLILPSSFQFGTYHQLVWAGILQLFQFSVFPICYKFSTCILQMMVYSASAPNILITFCSFFIFPVTLSQELVKCALSEVANLLESLTQY